MASIGAVDFFKKSFPLLAFGLLFTLTSSFGQTFLLSLYVPSLEKLLDISNTGLGSIYATATLCSAFILPWLGGYFDRMEIKRYVMMVLTGLTAALLLLSFSYSLVMVWLSILGLRLFGQGLMSHTAVSTMARYFTANRGKAIGAAILGHPAGEVIFPLLITLLIGSIGWRMTLQFSALSVAALIMPLALYLLYQSRVRIRAYEINARSGQGNGGVRPSLFQLMQERRFWIISPLDFMMGFTNTALFFFQLKLGDARGWTPEWVAGSISAYALAAHAGILVSGPLVDRFSGRRLYPFFIVPYLVGLGIIVALHHPLAYPLGMMLIGLSNGSGSTIKNAMLAEVYGVDRIGLVRSAFTTLIVFSTGIGPVVFGILLDLGWSFSLVYFVTLLALALVSVNATRRVSAS